MVFKRPVIIPALLSLVAMALFWYVSQQLPVVLVFIPATVISYFIYLNSFYKNIPAPERILPLYLLALAIQMLHFTEEYLNDFHIQVPQLLGQAEYSLDSWIVFNMLAYFVFILGGIVLFKKIRELMIIPLFFILVGVLLNAVGHLLISIYTGGYFPGLYTSIIYLILAPFFIKIILNIPKTELS